MVRTPRAVAWMVAALSLAGALAVILVLHRAASVSVERALEQRLLGAGRTAALWLQRTPATPMDLRALAAANELEAVYVVDGALELSMDSSSDAPSPRPADLLRVDADRVERALGGEETVSASYGVGEVTVLSGYFPLRDPDGQIRSVLGVEAGDAFARAKAGPQRALWLGLVLAFLTAVSLASVAVAWSRSEAARHRVEERAARAEVVSRMAAIAAHEIRNPLAVIRGTVELVNERHREVLPPRAKESLQDVLSEVQRLTQLTEDLLDLSADRALHLTPVELSALVEEARRAVEAAHPEIRVTRQSEPCTVEGDARRLRQVFSNLLENAAQAQGTGELVVALRRDSGSAQLDVRDQGPGIPPELRERIFEPFFTTRTQGTGLGLALSRRIVERHGGTVVLLPSERGTCFRITLPLAGPEPTQPS